MKTHVDIKTLRGYTEEEITNGEVKVSNLITMEEALKKGMSVVIWSFNDGDGNVFTLEAHHAGFMVWLAGDNYATKELRDREKAAVGTWFSFELHEQLHHVMKEHAHLVDGNGSFNINN